MQIASFQYLRKINKDTINKYQIPTAFYDKLKLGEDYETKEGNIIKNDWVTIANSPANSYGFCADTIYDEELIPIVKNVSLLYHESTYLKDMNDRAALRFHATSEQAATIAKKAEVGKLIMGHFSSKYENLDSFLEEAKAIFDNSELAIEGVTFINHFNRWVLFIGSLAKHKMQQIPVSNKFHYAALKD